MTLDNINTCYHNIGVDQDLSKIAENILMPIESSCKNFLSHGTIVFTFKVQDGKVVYQEIDCKKGSRIKDSKLVG
jgi:hypothetical protein|tara:strand:- start:173 stop:397 length:225 start_codon:yes stop_codon:yes gene_type:complete